MFISSPCAFAWKKHFQQKFRFDLLEEEEANKTLSSHQFTVTLHSNH